MPINLGTVDRSIRIVVGLVFIALAFMPGLGTIEMSASALVGIILVLTAAIRFCPLYRLVGLRTCKQ